MPLILPAKHPIRQRCVFLNILRYLLSSVCIRFARRQNLNPWFPITRKVILTKHQKDLPNDKSCLTVEQIASGGVLFFAVGFSTVFGLSSARNAVGVDPCIDSRLDYIRGSQSWVPKSLHYYCVGQDIWELLSKNKWRPKVGTHWTRDYLCHPFQLYSSMILWYISQPCDIFMSVNGIGPDSPAYESVLSSSPRVRVIPDPQFTCELRC